jgi:hypothetical protein
MLVLLVSISLELSNLNGNHNSNRKIIKTKATTPVVCNPASTEIPADCTAAFNSLSSLVNELYSISKKGINKDKRQIGMIKKKEVVPAALLAAMNAFLEKCPITSCRVAETGSTKGCKDIFTNAIDEAAPGQSLVDFVALCNPDEDSVLPEGATSADDTVDDSLNGATPGDNDNPQGDEKTSSGLKLFDVKGSGIILILLQFLTSLYFII